MKKFPTSFMYETVDPDIMNMLTPDRKLNNDKICKLVIFDNCLSNDFINKHSFRMFLNNAKKQNICVMILTNDNNVICSDICDKFDYTMVHSFTAQWNTDVSDHLIKKHPNLVNNDMLKNYMTECMQAKNCIIIYHNSPFAVKQF